MVEFKPTHSKPQISDAKKKSHWLMGLEPLAFLVREWSSQGQGGAGLVDTEGEEHGREQEQTAPKHYSPHGQDHFVSPPQPNARLTTS